MNNDYHFWMSRVAKKLYLLSIQGEYGEQWVFDWDVSLTLDKNLENVISEDRSLTVFTDRGAIKSERKDNFYRTQQLESLDDPLRGHGVFPEWDNFYPPKREYEYLRFVDGIFWDKFVAFCTEENINYKITVSLASISVSNQRPVVQVGNKTYTLSALQSGLPLDIIEQSIIHQNEIVTFEKLRLWTGKANTYKDGNNFNQIFRKNEFGKGNILHPFVEIKSNTFTLKTDTSLSDSDLSKIQKASTN